MTEPGDLVDAVRESIAETTGVTATLSTGGGTSDGRFIATMGSQIIELGPINASIHQRNEHVLIDDIPKLTRIYEGIMERLSPRIDPPELDLLHRKKVETALGAAPETLNQNAENSFRCIAPYIDHRRFEKDPAELGI